MFDIKWRKVLKKQLYTLIDLRLSVGDSLEQAHQE